MLFRSRGITLFPYTTLFRSTDFDLCFAFAHSDAGIAYAGTVSYISKAELYLLLFGRGAEDLAETVEFDCIKLVAKAVHNPAPLKKLIDEVID